MEIDIVFRIAAVGILVAVLNQVLVRAGRDDQAMLTTLAGLIVVLYWVIGYISELFSTIQTLFRFRRDKNGFDNEDSGCWDNRFCFGCYGKGV